MIRFNDIPFSPKMSQALSKLKINYVFQSIFYPDGKTIYAREALMRPMDKTVTDLITEYTLKNNLHTIEVATIFGATIAYFDRGYKELLSVNSFPCEVCTPEEIKAYIDYFGDKKSAMIIETLEYPEFIPEVSILKRKHISINNNFLAIDDFGAGINTSEIVHFLKPHIIKIDRSLLSRIDIDEQKQSNCANIISSAHNCGVKIVAEGIETEGEFNCMKQLGSDFFQGYYLGMPV